MDSTPAKSTRQLLVKIQNFQGLYRHSINGTYYAIKRVGGKRKEHSLQTTDRKIAERKLLEWVKSLEKIDTDQEKTSLRQLIEKYIASRQGLSKSTRATDAAILNRLKNEWQHGLDMRVSAVRPSQLSEWLASNEQRLKNTSYNRYCEVLRGMFEIAVADKMIVESPFALVKTQWKKPQKPKRVVPTQEQFQAIVDNIRSQQGNADAAQSANFVEFMGLAGLGQAEAHALTWGDIDWPKSEMHIKRQKTQERFQVPIYPHLRPLLEKILAALPEPPKPNARVFTIHTARKALTMACKRLGIHIFTQRNLRAALIRRLWQSGVDVKFISKWQGHTDGGRLILNTYTEVFGANDEEYKLSQLAKIK